MADKEKNNNTKESAELEINPWGSEIIGGVDYEYLILVVIFFNKKVNFYSSVSIG